MPDQYDSNGQLTQPEAAAPELTADGLHANLFAAPAAAQPAPAALDLPAIAEQVIQAEAGPIAGVISEVVFDKLKTILGALGHELPVFFDEAVALAKKAL